MANFLNNATALGAHRPIEVLGNAQTKTLGSLSADASKAHEANVAVENVLTEDAAAVHPKLYTALQSILTESSGVELENARALASYIKDSNAANEVINLAKFQILNQSGSSALGQVNKDAQAVLSLLK